MHRKTTMTTALVGVLCALLLGAPAMAAGRWAPASRPAAASTPGAFSAEALASRVCFWLYSLLEKGTACIDPNGRCGSSPPVPTKDSLCIDPNGRCAASPNAGAPSQVDDGMCIDPNGLGCLAVSHGR